MKKFTEILAEKTYSVSKYGSPIMDEISDAKEEGISKSLIKKMESVYKRFEKVKSKKIDSSTNNKVERAINNIMDHMWSSDKEFGIVVGLYDKLVSVIEKG